MRLVFITKWCLTLFHLWKLLYCYPLCFSVELIEKIQCRTIEALAVYGCGSGMRQEREMPPFVSPCCCMLVVSPWAGEYPNTGPRASRVPFSDELQPP